ncbi:MAG: TonB-dependent receptor [Bacteroidota bacterium]
MKHKIFIILFLSLFSYQFSFSQGTLKGKIVDEDSEEALIGATVAVKGTTSGTATDVDGSFTLKVESGTVPLELSYVGYQEKELEVEVEEGETKDLGNIGLASESVAMEEVKVVADFAKDRETPVAASKIEPLEIQEKLGTQSFTKVLKSTPSVYATEGGGGFGDGDIHMRGFSGENIGVLVNGVPVNDMENGQVYWSNWAGLSNVTRTVQVQRGLGASKLAISSVGGTMNIVTQSTQSDKGGSIYQGMGNDGYMKTGFNVSTGLMDNGWAVTLSGQKESGDGYVEATKFEAYTYFFNIAKRINDDHRLSFTGFGTPQWHNQRGSMHMIEDYREAENGGRLNTHYGYWNGEIMMTGYAYNEYHKPQFSLNHYWDINNTTKLSTAVYASFGNGGGKGTSGESSNWLEFDYPSGKPMEQTKLTNDGLLDYESVHEENAQAPNGSEAIFTMRRNQHDWYGVLSSFNTKFSNIDFTLGFDGRYYRGDHFTEVTNLLGGEYFLDNTNVNRDPGTPLDVGDKIAYHNLGDVVWGGLFAQGEYTTDQYSGFLSVSFSDKSYRRIDKFSYFNDDLINEIENDQELKEDYIDRLGENSFDQAMEGQYSDWVHYLTYSAKGGFNYNIDDNNNVFVNGGYFTRAPYFSYAFVGYTNEINNTLEVEKVISTEAGYGYVSDLMKVDFTLYRTNWKNKGYSTSTGQGGVATTDGIDALHMGAELEVRVKPTDNLKINFMASYGDWKWNDDALFDYYDRNQDFLYSDTVHINDVSVGGSAQTTAALGVEYQPIDELKLSLDANHFSRLFAGYDVEERIETSTKGKNSWELPDYQLIDFNASYYFDIAGFDASLYAHVHNILNTEYISYAQDGVEHNAQTSPVYYGHGRTWSMGLSLRF